MKTTTDTQFTIIARNINTDRNFFWAMNRTATKYSDGLVITGRDGRKMASFKIPADVEFVHDTEIVGTVYFNSGKVYGGARILVKVHQDGHISLIAQVTP
jgi:hypothetical protein